MYFLDYIENLFSDKAQFIVFALYAITFFWIFSNYKIKLEEQENVKNQRIDTSITNTYLLMCELKKYCNSEANEKEIDNLIGLLLPYINIELSSVLLNWRTEDITIIDEKLKLLLKSLKESQYISIDDNYNKTIGRTIYEVINTTGLKIITKSVAYTFFTTLLLFIILISLLSSVGKSFIEVMSINAVLIYFCFIFAITTAMVDIYQMKKSKFPFKKLYIFLCMTYIPLVIIIILLTISIDKVAKILMLIQIILLFALPFTSGNSKRDLNKTNAKL